MLTLQHVHKEQILVGLGNTYHPFLSTTVWSYTSTSIVAWLHNGLALE